MEGFADANANACAAAGVRRMGWNRGAEDVGLMAAAEAVGRWTSVRRVRSASEEKRDGIFVYRVRLAWLILLDDRRYRLAGDKFPTVGHVTPWV